MEQHTVPSGITGLPCAVLAYIGDAVFELLIREQLVAGGKHRTTRALHLRASRLVCAQAQARMARTLAAELTPEESAILKRGRNTHCGRVPPGAEVMEYRLATGFETLVGFLHLAGRDERIRALLATAFETVSGEDDG